MNAPRRQKGAPSKDRSTGSAQCHPLSGSHGLRPDDVALRFLALADAVPDGFRRFVRRLLFNTIHDIALMVDTTLA